MLKFKNYKFKAVDAVKRTIEGLASTFGNKDLDGDIIETFAFDQQLSDHNDELVVKGLWQHQFFSPIALVSIKKVAEGLFNLFDLAEGVRQADEAIILAEKQVIDSFSIGFMILEEHFSADRGANIITKAELREVSLVTFPANPLARISDVKNAKDKAEFKARIIEALRNGVGLSIKDAETFCAVGFSGLGNLDGDKSGMKELTAALRKNLINLKT